jgi:hypothetical protein
MGHLFRHYLFFSGVETTKWYIHTALICIYIYYYNNNDNNNNHRNNNDNNNNYYYNNNNNNCV